MLALVGLFFSLLQPVWADEEYAGTDFESLYQGTQTQHPSADNLDLDLDPVIENAANEMREAGADGPQDDLGDGRKKSVDWSKDQGDWEVAPVVLGRRQDGQATDSNVLVPLGVEFSRDF